MAPSAILFYDVVLTIHIAAAVVAFGATFAYPFFQGVIERTSPRSVPAMWRAMHTCDRYLVLPGALIVLAAGIYLTIDRFDFGYLFVNVGLIVVIVLLILAMAVFGPSELRAAELAERDIERAGAAEVELSDEYWAVSKRVAQVGTLAGILIVVSVFFMAAKP